MQDFTIKAIKNAKSMCFKPCMFFHCCTIRHKILTNIFRILIYKNKMIVGQNEYNGASGILGNFFHEWRHHEHIPYKNEPFMENILADHSIEAFKVGHRIFQGVVISVGFGTLMQFVKGGDRKLFTNRSALNPTLFANKFRFHVAYGALAGLAWFFIYDQVFCPHGKATFARHVLAHSVGGSLVAMTLFNPSSFFLGGVMGGLLGIAKDSAARKKGPQGFEASHPMFSPEMREKARRDDVEKMLSRNLVLASAQNNCKSAI